MKDGLSFVVAVSLLMLIAIDMVARLEREKQTEIIQTLFELIEIHHPLPELEREEKK